MHLLHAVSVVIICALPERKQACLETVEQGEAELLVDQTTD